MTRTVMNHSGTYQVGRQAQRRYQLPCRGRLLTKSSLSGHRHLLLPPRELSSVLCLADRRLCSHSIGYGQPQGTFAETIPVAAANRPSILPLLTTNFRLRLTHERQVEGLEQVLQAACLVYPTHSSPVLESTRTGRHSTAQAASSHQR